MTNHSSSINVVCNAAKGVNLVSPSNLSQNLNVKRLQASTSFELLPITPPMIPEENTEKQEYDFSPSPEKKCAASQTIEDTLIRVNDKVGKESSKKEIPDNNREPICRCPNCKCANCAQEDKDSDTDNDNISRYGFRVTDDDDDDSGTESYTNEEARRRLSVSSFAKASASVLIHSCFSSKSPQ